MRGPLLRAPASRSGARTPPPQASAELRGAPRPARPPRSRRGRGRASRRERPQGTPAWQGTWEGRYDAKKGSVVLPPKVKDAARQKDDGKQVTGAGTVTPTIEASGELKAPRRERSAARPSWEGRGRQWSALGLPGRSARAERDDRRPGRRAEGERHPRQDPGDRARCPPGARVPHRAEEKAISAAWRDADAGASPGCVASARRAAPPGSPAGARPCGSCGTFGLRGAAAPPRPASARRSSRWRATSASRLSYATMIRCTSG